MTGYFSALWVMLQGGLIAFAILVLLDIVFGVVAALVLKKFKWEYLMHFVNTDLIPISVWIGAVVLSTIPAEQIPKEAVLIASNIIYVSVFLSILASIMGSWKDLGVLTEQFTRIGIGDMPIADKPQ